MGQSSSSERRRRNHTTNNSYPHPQPYSPRPPPPPPPPASSYPYGQPAQNLPAYYPNNPNYPPPPYSNNNSNYSSNSYTYQQLTAGYNSLVRLVDSLIGRGGGAVPYSQPQHHTPPYYYYGPDQGHGWRAPSPYPHPSASSSSSTAMMLPPQYVEHQNAKTVKNDVNVRRDSIKLEVDEEHPEKHLVSFTFDAMADGSVIIYYFAQEGASGSFSPVYADMYTPRRVSFQKGLGQKFQQPSGSGIDLGFFEEDELSKPSNADVFPLVIYAEANSQPQTTEETADQHKSATCAQITQAVIQKTNGESFQAKVVKQILWANGERYELQEIFGIENSVTNSEAELEDDNANDTGKECVICLSEPRNTAVLPCRHMCMCSECAKALRLQSNKCPVCRQTVEKLMEINVNKAEHR